MPIEEKKTLKWIKTNDEKYKQLVNVDKSSRNSKYVREKRIKGIKNRHTVNGLPANTTVNRSESESLKNRKSFISKDKIPDEMKQNLMKFDVEEKQSSFHQKTRNSSVSEEPNQNKNINRSVDSRKKRMIHTQNDVKRRSVSQRLVRFTGEEIKHELKEVSGVNDTVIGDFNHGYRQVKATKDGVKKVVRTTKNTAKVTGKGAKKAFSLAQNRRQIFLKAQQRTVKMGQAIAKFVANPLVVIQGAGYAALGLIVVGLLLVVVVAVTSLFSSTTTKANEAELTKTWTYLTELDANASLAVRNGDKSLEVNGTYATRAKFELNSTLNETLAYLDVMYGDYELDRGLFSSKVAVRPLIDVFYGGMVSSTTTKDKESLTIKSLTEVVDFNDDVKEQVTAMQNVGQYASIIDLQSPFIENEQLLVNKRYGYYVSGKEKKMFDGIQLQVNEGDLIAAPLAGEVTTTDTSLTITTKTRKLKIKNVTPTVTKGKVKRGDKIGQASKENGLVIEYKKDDESRNPGFYFPNIQYTQSNNLGYSSLGSGFSEDKFRWLISLRCNAFSGKADKIIEVAKENGISPVILAAIMIHESAWGTSEAILSKNNPSGQMSSSGLISYPTLDAGIEATGRTLKNLIIDRKLQTVEQLGSVYCPIGAANDPTGLNANWVPAIKDFMEQLGGSRDMSLLWSEAAGVGGSVLENAESLYKKGVQYSQDPSKRGTFPYHDCSSFVSWAMQQAGIDVPIGSTETLYGWEGTILQPISRSEVNPGDIFVWGTKGASSGNYGHTGFFLDDGGKNILHCTPATSNGYGQEGDVVKTPFEGYFGDTSLAPVYFYRIVGGDK